MHIGIVETTHRNNILMYIRRCTTKCPDGSYLTGDSEMARDWEVIQRELETLVLLESGEVRYMIM